MIIQAYIGNPVITNYDEYKELEQRVAEIDPDLESIKILPTKVVIARIARRTFPFGANPSIDWIAAKVKYMSDNNL